MPDHSQDAPGEVSDIVVGRVGKPFGLAGDVYVFLDPDLLDPVVAGAVYAVEGGRSLTVAQARQHADRFVVSFVGVGTREAAEALRGTILSTPREQVALAGDMIWVADLKGRQVVDGDGAVVGMVETVADGHAHDYLVIARPDGGEAIIPLVEELVDWSADPVVVTVPPGLLDPDEAW